MSGQDLGCPLSCRAKFQPAHDLTQPPRRLVHLMDCRIGLWFGFVFAGLIAHVIGVRKGASF
jgi:hypothetical protein